MELVALYWMHGVEGAWHGFLRLNDTAAIAFVFSDQIKKTKPVKNVTYAGTLLNRRQRGRCSTSL
ncbi:MAG: hypothetical protein ABJH52_01620 [Henriciella sp.]